MRTVSCAACEQTFRLGETFTVEGRVLCAECGEQFFQGLDEDRRPEVAVARQVDPTVCAWCGTDAGDASLPELISHLPTCGPCDERMRNWPYPKWVKGSFVALLALAVMSFALNWRFLDALWSVRKAGRAAQRGDVPAAARYWQRAADDVPDQKEFVQNAALYRGMELCLDDRSAEAVAVLRKIPQEGPGASEVRLVLLMAEVGEAFDRQDYDAMVAKAELLEQLDSNVAAYRTASAYACRFASRGDDADRLKALEKLAAAEQAGPADPLSVDRIRHRLETREIIDGKEFQRRFPNGWRGGAKKP